MDIEDSLQKAGNGKREMTVIGGDKCDVKSEQKLVCKAF